MNTFVFNLILYVVFLWSLFWKGIGLWRAANSGQKIWFVAMLILSTVGILEIVYLFRFAKNRLTLAELKSWFAPYSTMVTSKITSSTASSRKKK